MIKAHLTLTCRLWYNRKVWHAHTSRCTVGVRWCASSPWLCVVCVCVFFSSKMTCNGHLNQTHPHSQLRGWVGLGRGGCGVRSDLCYKSCYKHMTGFWIQGPSRWVFLVSPSPLLSLLGHPSGANILSDSRNLVRPAHAWLRLTLQFWCESATSVPVRPPQELLGSRVGSPVAAADDVLCDAGTCDPPLTSIKWDAGSSGL